MEEYQFLKGKRAKREMPKDLFESRGGQNVRVSLSRRAYLNTISQPSWQGTELEKFRLSSPSKAIFKTRNQGIKESENRRIGEGGTGSGERGTGNAWESLKWGIFKTGISLKAGILKMENF